MASLESSAGCRITGTERLSLRAQMEIGQQHWRDEIRVLLSQAFLPHVARNTWSMYSVEPEVRASNWLFMSENHEQACSCIQLCMLEQLVIYVLRERPILMGDYTGACIYGVRYFKIFSNRVLCCDFITLYKSKKCMQNDTLCIVFGLVSQKLQRSKHCILSERYSMRDRRNICDGLCSLYCSY